MTEFEYEVLDTLAGNRGKGQWGAAVGVAIEYLQGMGYVDSRWQVTMEGALYLDQRKLEAMQDDNEQTD